MISMTLGQFFREECFVDGHLQHLSPHEANLLRALLNEHPGTFLSADRLIEEMWSNPDLEPEEALRMVRVYVGRLRNLGIAIETDHGFGYRIPLRERGWAEPVRVAA